jgi:hypothetical protein
MVGAMYLPRAVEPLYVPPLVDQFSSLPPVAIRTLPRASMSPWFEFDEMADNGDIVVHAARPEKLFDDVTSTTYWDLCGAGITRLRLGYAYSQETRYLAGRCVDATGNSVKPHEHIDSVKTKSGWEEMTLTYPGGPFAIKVLNRRHQAWKTTLPERLLAATVQFDRTYSVVRFVAEPTTR